MLARVAITGLGAVSALGHEARSLWASVAGGKVGIGPIANIPTARLNVKIAAEVKGFDADQHFDRRRLPMLDRAAQFAVVAAREAIGDAKISFDDPGRAGVILGATGAWTTVDDSYHQFYGQEVTRLHPLTIPRIMPNAPVSQITIEHGIAGPAFTISSACASASHAIGMAFRFIRDGALDAVVTGGSDASIAPGFLKGWDALRVLSADTCRPFSKNRSGLVIGEGAGIVVLEKLETAVARGAPIYAELVGFGMNADGKDMTAPDLASSARSMTAALRDADLAPDDVDYVNAHGTATRLNDSTESAALHRVFGNHLPAVAVSSSKSMFGHTLAAAGALEIIVTALALRDGIVPPTMNMDEPDPECDLDCVPNTARRAEIDVAMSNSFAFGGLNAVLLARRF
ncbi:MAG: beta-ketoacyl-[acyl-carrier-protein] synthase family protein, partial [Alphaproteobacteria bacterium]|nr:beta-ketoacyl-[acyl-carrier-protein] synthase family protein [Alphaproteobacteria bacterium]